MKPGCCFQRLCGLKRAALRTLQAVAVRADLYRKLALLNRSRLLFVFMDILQKLLLHDEWLRFLDYKKSGGHLTKRDEEELEDFIFNKKYVYFAEYLISGGVFSVPEAVFVNKSFSDKKRTVFKFSDEEKLIQKMIAFELLDYDFIFCDNLFSFRQNMGVKKAVKSIIAIKDISSHYSFKLDISDYFNSVKPELVLPMLKVVLSDNERLYNVFESLLTEPYSIVDNEKCVIKKGILAGSPLSGFLANLYLVGLDKYFYENEIVYARYSDDIIVFAKSEAELKEYISYIYDYLKEYKLSVNSDKVSISEPHSEWSFLGFSYDNGTIDISDVSKNKLKKKMRRKARALYRWRVKKEAAPERAVSAYVKYFNKKLYSNPVVNEITWSRWYFPIINTDKSLKELDEYMQNCIRYLATGKQNRGKYIFSYEDMKDCGYVSLVNRYYKFKLKDEIYIED